MKIGVVHQISDQEAFQQQGQALMQPPEGMQLLQFAPSRDLTIAACIWESESLESVRDLLDGTLAGASTQTYFEIAPDQAVGLPEAAAAATA